MKLYYAYLTATLLISTVSSSPLPTIQITESSPSNEISQLPSPSTPHIAPRSSVSPFGTLALLSAGTALFTGLGIGLSEWFLHWYPRHLSAQHTLSQRNLTFSNDLQQRKEQQARRERAMDLILDLAENHADHIANGFSGEGFDGDYEPLRVPKGIIGVVENVFETTEGVDGRGVEALEGLKEAVAPVLDLSGEDGEPAPSNREMVTRSPGKGVMVSEGTSDQETIKGDELDGKKGGGVVSLHKPEGGGSFTANHRFDVIKNKGIDS